MVEGREHIADKFHSIHLPDKARLRIMSLGGSIFWRTILSKISDFVEDQNEETLEIADIVPIWNKISSLLSKRMSGCPLSNWDKLRNMKEKEMMKREKKKMDGFLWLRRKSKRKTSEPDLKRKGIAESSEK